MRAKVIWDLLIFHQKEFASYQNSTNPYGVSVGQALWFADRVQEITISLHELYRIFLNLLES